MAKRIRAIPIEYNGIRYRSLLEAKWALFFDILGVEFLYECDKYKLGDISYIPDFYIPHLGIFIEIKGTTPKRIECEKAYRLAHLEKKDVFIIHSNFPRGSTRKHIRYFGHSNARKMGGRGEYAISRCYHNGHIGLQQLDNEPCKLCGHDSLADDNGLLRAIISVSSLDIRNYVALMENELRHVKSFGHSSRLV